MSAETDLPWFPAITTFLGYAVLIAFGQLRDWVGKLMGAIPSPPEGIAPLLRSFEAFYIRRLYHRINDCWNRPLSSAAGAWVDVIDRKRVDAVRFELQPTKTHCLNLGSYNYLGFGDASSPTEKDVLKAVREYGTSTCSPRLHLGTTALHQQLDETVAKFVRKPAAMTFSMGYGTNSTVIPVIVGKGCLIVSDELNHASIVSGARYSGAKIVTFKHNSAKSLEKVLRKAIVSGQPRSHRPWRKILVVVEGVYSMEGEVCKLKEIVAVKKKYKCYLYLDEAHSIGAMGATGRGVAEHCGVDPADVDMMMGTFTKSFGAVGGYIAASKPIIHALRQSCAGTALSAGLSPPAVQQVLSALHLIAHTDDGKRRIKQLHDNANYFRAGMKALGVQVLGENDSPVVPVMLGNPAKIPAFSRECLKRDLAVVVVGFPATPILSSRVRFCLSSAHTKEDLDFALKRLKEVCEVVHIRYKDSWTG